MAKSWNLKFIDRECCIVTDAEHLFGKTDEASKVEIQKIRDKVNKLSDDDFLRLYDLGIRHSLESINNLEVDALNGIIPKEDSERAIKEYTIHWPD